MKISRGKTRRTRWDLSSVIVLALAAELTTETVGKHRVGDDEDFRPQLLLNRFLDLTNAFDRRGWRIVALGDHDRVIVIDHPVRVLAVEVVPRHPGVDRVAVIGAEDQESLN